MTVNKTMKKNGFKITIGKITKLDNVNYLNIEGINADNIYIYNNKIDIIDDIDIIMHRIPSLKDIKITSNTRKLNKNGTKVRHIKIKLGNRKTIDLTFFEDDE